MKKTIRDFKRYQPALIAVIEAAVKVEVHEEEDVEYTRLQQELADSVNALENVINEALKLVSPATLKIINTEEAA